MLHIYDFRYIPDPLTVPPGATVTVMSFPTQGQTAEETEPHTVTSSTDRSLFDVRDIPADGSPHPFTAPAEPGTYPYYCIYHGAPDGSGMAGTLIVDGAAATPPGAPAATPTAAPTATPTEGGANGTPLAGWLLIAASVAAAALLRRR